MGVESWTAVLAAHFATPFLTFPPNGRKEPRSVVLYLAVAFLYTYMKTLLSRRDVARRVSTHAFCFLLCLCLSSVVHAESQAEFRACLLEDNLPLSSAKENNGFDFETAKAVASALNRAFVPVWAKNFTQIQEIEESDFPTRKLSKNECDAIFSMPGEEAIKDAPKAALGAAYYGAAFELIGREGVAQTNLNTLGDAPVAVQAQTIANFVLSARKTKMHTFFSVPSALEGVTKGEASFALLWGPLAGWHLRSHPEMKLILAAGYEPPAVVCWNEHVATRKTDTELRSQIDAALAKLADDGTLKTLMERYGIPFHKPFAATYSFAEMQKLK
jgi:polar amino acid transport system substrate-binding protein